MSTTTPRRDCADGVNRKKREESVRPHEEYSVLQCDGLLPLPPRIQEAARLRTGAIITVSLTDGGILLEWRRPTHNSETWPQAQRRLTKLQAKAAKEQAERGNEIFYSDEEFLADLEADSLIDADV
jgi:hypothetical protein